MITISLCMIVKNEEQVLERCLDSIKDLMDEIIIVDTGSNDGTKQIAGRYTDKIYDFEWIDDFAAARNESFSHATMDYIYVADADEVLDEENRKKFRLLKEAMLPEIDIVQMYYKNQLANGTAYNFDREYRPKLYKRVRKFEWIEPVHEMVRLEPVVYDSDIEIEHRPLSNHSGRDFGVFIKHYGNGMRLSKRLHHMFAMELYISGKDEDFISAAEIFEDTLSDVSRSMDEIKEAMVILERAYRIQGDIESFFRVTAKDAASGPSAETCCELGEYYYERKNYDEACIWFLNAANESESILSIKTSGETPYSRLASCYENMGEKELAGQYLEALANIMSKKE
ncbi:MAG: glycosyltransferase family 2 protein [Lachnospiraceae bacterium]|nr:glycosyltransferase family 2 protein [Lachnospiraceae bacterium]